MAVRDAGAGPPILPDMRYLVSGLLVASGRVPRVESAHGEERNDGDRRG